MYLRNLRKCACRLDPGIPIESLGVAKKTDAIRKIRFGQPPPQWCTVLGFSACYCWQHLLLISSFEMNECSCRGGNFANWPRIPYQWWSSLKWKNLLSVEQIISFLSWPLLRMGFSVRKQTNKETHARTRTHAHTHTHNLSSLVNGRKSSECIHYL